MREGMTREDTYRAIDSLVEELLDEAGIAGPPVDAVALARHLGLEPPRPSASRPEWLALRAATPEQQQRDAAAQLADHLRDDLRSRLGLDETSARMPGESPGRLFAERLLVPTGWLAAEARECGNDLLELKGRFCTAGHEAIAWRMLDLGPPCVVTVAEAGRVARRRASAGQVGKQLAPAEAACLAKVRAEGTPCRVCDEGWDVRGWPLPGGRIVLRAVVDE